VLAAICPDEAQPQNINVSHTMKAISFMTGMISSRLFKSKKVR
jgi:hypothetical protein